MQAVDEKLSALERMWEAHRDPVRRMLIGLARDLDVADDLLQETYLRARSGISGYRGGDGRAWLSAIARNVFHTYRRHRYLTSETLLDGAQETTGDEAPLFDRDELMAIRQALSALRPALRTALIMKHYAGYTYQEIARHQRCPVGTAKWRVSEALHRLRLVLVPERRMAMAGSAQAHGIGLVDYAYRVLAEDEEAKVRAHLAECSACRKEAAELKRVASLLDALEGDHRQMHFVELDQEGRVTLYSSGVHLNDSGETLTISEFQSGGAPDHVYQEGEEVAFVRAPKARHPGLESFVATLRRPVPPGERLSELLVYLPRPGWGAEKLGDGRFRLFWKQGPGSTHEFAYVQAIRLPAGAELISADPESDERRGDGSVTLVWRRVLAPAAFFECTVEYRLGDCG